MSMMRFAAVLVLASAVALVGCSKKNQPAPESPKAEATEPATEGGGGGDYGAPAENPCGGNPCAGGDDAADDAAAQ